MRRTIAIPGLLVCVLLCAPARAEEDDAAAVATYRQTVRELAPEQTGGVTDCQKEARKRGVEIVGVLKVGWIIDREGTVAAAKVLRSTVEDESFEACVVEAAKAWGFPPPQGTHFVKMSRTYTFRPAPPRRAKSK